ncbi:hypothetical protein FOXB_01478 [Fusarium oxysporum f. sp. conglutinans Fo5176]|uniref:Uncharacterized protein n=1 Tax=Fusarium oxysporum (strain Fo5176) TaxID=660025 RepID=F9F503_FUSOF|nr:hypothetical protein FOXB_01478 [Fusarium oxysporum f. sp. conglutinans Fo5176]
MALTNQAQLIKCVICYGNNKRLITSCLAVVVCVVD